MLVTLDRPERLNAMTEAMFDELQNLADRLRGAADTRVVILTGAGRAFCAGYDLDDADALSRLGARGMYTLQSKAARALEAVRSIPQPVIAAVNGAASGGGLSLALAADMRFGVPITRFNAAFVRIGLTAGDLGASWHLPRIVGPGIAAELMFTGRFVEAEEAARLGLLNRVVPTAELLPECFNVAEQICVNSPFGVQLSKSALQANLDGLSLRSALELENRGQALATRGNDMPEALAAFKERRAPQFGG
ncbi:enoyl-CoA hydratase-related protein [Hydrocarboniphaga sp.]|uniref:enoyl-CoA hydratase/isomerase family protein n=1 Tax=Hydrocarboniphaga sp. TaxID=2033016 RepID=UPI0034573A9E